MQNTPVFLVFISDNSFKPWFRQKQKRHFHTTKSSSTEFVNKNILESVKVFGYNMLCICYDLKTC